MTNPPQQPGPYGEQPGQFPQSGQFPPGQPGQYGQPSGQFPQQPGQFGQFPGQSPQRPQQQSQPSGPFPQVDPTTGFPYGQGAPQQPGYPGVGGYATQSNPYGLPSDAFSPRPKRSALPWVLGGAGLVVIGITITLVFVLTGGTDLTTPRGLAEATLAATEDADAEAYNELLCADASESQRATPAELTLFADPKMIGEPVQTGDQAQVNFSVTYDGQPRTGRIRMAKESDGNWCIDRLSSVR